MSPHPQITPAPVLRPRQSDQYLSSLYAELSSMYPDLYSSYSYDGSYYSSLLDSIRSDSDYYSSILNDIYSGYSIPLPTATDDTLVRTGSTTDPTGVSRGSSTSNTNSSSGGGLSTGAKIGIGVGVPLAVLLLIGIGVFLWCAGKRRGKKSSTTVVAPPTSTQYQPHTQIPVPNQPPPSQMGYANNQGYMPGYQQQGYQNMPPPQYVQPSQGAYPVAGYAKPPGANVVELEQEYHFARPGVIEMGDGMPEQAQGKKKGNK